MPLQFYTLRVEKINYHGYEYCDTYHHSGYDSGVLAGDPLSGHV